MIPQNIAHIHLLLNAIPAIGLAFGVLMAILGWRRRKPDIVRGGLLTFIVVAVIAIPIYLTGLGAAADVRGLPDITPPLVAAHERSAVFTFILVLAVGVISLGGYYFHRRVRLINPSFLYFILFLAIVAEILVLRSSVLGLRINHPEVRPGYRPAPESVMPMLENNPDTLRDSLPR